MEPADKIIYGCWVATSEFYRALIKYGGFDEYHFFSGRNLPAFERRPPEEFLDRNNVKIKKLEKLPFYLKDTRYTIFFTSKLDLAGLSNLRHRYAYRYFPVCGMAQALSYQHLLADTIFSNLLSDLTPFDSIICNSTAALKALRNLNRLVKKTFFKEKGLILEHRARLDCLPLGVNADCFGGLDKSEARKRLDLPKDKIILLYFGRFSISDKMDIYPLLAAFKNLLSKNKNILLVLAGTDTEGGYVSELKELVREMALVTRVKFYLRPSLVIKRKQLLYSASDIFISPGDNIQETFGLTVLEAMASGLPVVVSDWDGYRDIVIHGKTGFRVPTYWANCDRKISELSQLFMHFRLDHMALSQSVCVDIEKMTNYLSILIRRKGLRRQFGLEAKRRILKSYDWRVVIPAYERLWRQLSFQSKDYKVKRKKTELFVPKYFATFHHYASKLINKATRLGIGQAGILAVKTGNIPRVHPEIKHLLSIEIIFMILTFLSKRHTARLAEIQSYLRATLKQASSDNISYHIMWLLKNNFLRLG